MAIENRFASEEYVLNELQNYEDTHKPDWEENNPESGNYIQNKTHTKEKITLTWDGNYTDTLETYTIYDTNESNLKLIKISDQIPASRESLSVFGVCKIQHNNEIFSSEDNSVKRIVYYMPKIFNHLSGIAKDEFTAESIGIVFQSQEDSRADSYFNLLKVLFVLSEGTFEGVTLTPGVYFTDFTYRGSDNFKTVEYSFTAYNKIDDSYLKKSLSNFSYSDNNNISIHSYSTVEGYNNFVGPLILSYDILFNEASEFEKKNPINDVEEIFASHAEGRDNQILTKCSHGEGYGNKLRIPYSHIEGYKNTGGDVEKDSTIFSHYCGCHIEGVSNKCGGGEGTHVEGYMTMGSGRGSHAEGESTVAFTDGTHAQNIKTRAQGIGSTASGFSSMADGNYSDAGGSNTKAAHSQSFTRGWWTETGSSSQAVVGQYNEIFTDSFFDVGNGNSTDDRKTAFSVKHDGSARLQTQGETEDSITRKDYVDTLVANSKENTIKELLNITNAIDSWESVQKIVRAGYAPLIFNIGDQLTCSSEQFGELVWDIIGFDQDIPSDSQYTHSMTLQLHNILDKKVREYDSQEFTFKITEDLGPGDYHLSYVVRFTQTTMTNIGFTIPEGITIPANSYIYRTGSSQVSFVSFDLSETFYTAATSTLGSTPPEGSIYLGEIAYAPGNIGGQGGGSNYYPYSGIRFFLNGENSTLDWVSSHELDRPPSYVNDPGFLYQIDSDFREVLGPVNKLVYNFVEGTIEEISELIFLPSATELYGIPAFNQEGDRAVNLGEPYEYYVIGSGLDAPTSNNSITCRIKYDSENIATPYYLRSPYIASPTSAIASAQESRISTVSPTGTIGQSAVNGTGNGARYLAPCCCIV